MTTETDKTSQALQKVPQQMGLSIYANAQTFEEGQRVAKMLAASTMVPTVYQGNIANTLVALEVANRMQVSPLMVMQNLDVINGKPGFNAKFTAALVNNCGKYSQLRYQFTGEGDARTCKAVATELSTGNIMEGPPCSIKLAKAEGWWDKKGSKWPNMPELMLTYRAAKFWANVYEPGLTMGIPTTDEILDITDYSTSTDTAAPSGVDKINAAVKTVKVEFTDHQEVKDENTVKAAPVSNEEII